MEWLLKSLTPQSLLSFLPLILLQLGSYLKNKDANSTGTDDAAGNILIALAPAVTALSNNNENAFKKSLRIVRDTISVYLGD